MILLRCPIQWGGHLIPAGKHISLPAWLEEKLLQAGSAARPEAASSPPQAEPDGKAETALAERGEKNDTEKETRRSRPPNRRLSWSLAGEHLSGTRRGGQSRDFHEPRRTGGDTLCPVRRNAL